MAKIKSWKFDTINADHTIKLQCTDKLKHCKKKSRVYWKLI